METALVILGGIAAIYIAYILLVILYITVRTLMVYALIKLLQDPYQPKHAKKPMNYSKEKHKNQEDNSWREEA